MTIEASRQHALEHWRDRLLAEPDALDALAADHPRLDRPRLRALIARARDERERGGPPHAYRELFRELKALASRWTLPIPSHHRTTLARMSDPIAADRPRLDLRPRLRRRLRGQGHARRCTEWFTAALTSPWRMETRLIPDEQPVIERTLIELIDIVGCHLVLTTGGTGPAPRDVTPEATLAVAHKVLPGFGEQMRQVSLKYVPDGDPVAAGRRRARPRADPQPSRPAEGDQGNARRHFSRPCRTAST